MSEWTESKTYQLGDVVTVFGREPLWKRVLRRLGLYRRPRKRMTGKVVALAPPTSFDPSVDALLAALSGPKAMIAAADLIDRLQSLPEGAVIHDIQFFPDGAMVTWGDWLRSHGGMSLEPSPVKFSPLADTEAKP